MNIKVLFQSVFLSMLLISLIQCSSDFDDMEVSENLELENRALENYIIVLEDGLDLNSLDDVRGLGKGILKNINASQESEHVYAYSIKGLTAKLSPGHVKKLLKLDEVKSIEKDETFALAPPAGKGWNKPDSGNDNQPAQTTPWGISRVNGGVSCTDCRAWILDTGIDLDHSDLNVDRTNEFTAYGKGRRRTANDGNGHGTHVAGTIAALDNNFGVIGVAPGAKVVPVKVLDDAGSGSYSAIIAGVDHVAQYGQIGDVANMSLGGGISSSLDNAVLNAAASSGVKFVIAAGNSSVDTYNTSPARVNGPNIYSISAMDVNDNFASFSNFGSPVDYCAPGVSVKSTWNDGMYHTISGTSMAAPHAAGILLLGNASTDGNVNNDPDGNADAIIVH